MRTLHSLTLEIVRLAESGLGEDTAGPEVLDDTRSNGRPLPGRHPLIEAYPDQWYAFSPKTRRNCAPAGATSPNAPRAPSSAPPKNERYRPEEILQRLETGDQQRDEPHPILESSISQSPSPVDDGRIYSRYQTILNRQAHSTFDDHLAGADLLQNRPHFADELRRRWPYVLEDEAQDSVPLQEVPLTQLTGANGNWVRVGDPNQAIPALLTAAHPASSTPSSTVPSVVARPPPNSGRCAPLIGARPTSCSIGR
ncbi:MAG: ATP-dependent helicase [bacterium]|nr:ATP-dependent helicase [bacterium]